MPKTYEQIREEVQRTAEARRLENAQRMARQARDAKRHRELDRFLRVIETNGRRANAALDAAISRSLAKGPPVLPSPRPSAGSGGGEANRGRPPRPPRPPFRRPDPARQLPPWVVVLLVFAANVEGLAPLLQAAGFNQWFAKAIHVETGLWMHPALFVVPLVESGSCVAAGWLALHDTRRLRWIVAAIALLIVRFTLFPELPWA